MNLMFCKFDCLCLGIHIFLLLLPILKYLYLLNKFSFCVYDTLQKKFEITFICNG